MKLKSAFFVFVLLLLTVTVCAAQTPMGFSPDSFYQTFQQVYESFDGPACSYYKGDEETGASLIFSDELFVNIGYKENEINEVYIVFPFGDDVDDKTWGNCTPVIVSTTLSLFIESGMSPDDIDVDGCSAMLVDLLSNGTPQEYSGFYFEFDFVAEDDSGAGLIRVTKSEAAAPTPMVFSPDEFYPYFELMNSSFGGPECEYMKDDEKSAAMIVNNDSIGVLMYYEEDKVTEMNFYYMYLSSDKEASNDAYLTGFSTLFTLWVTYQIDLGVDVDAIDINAGVSEVKSVYNPLLKNGTTGEYWGYRFESKAKEEDGYDQGFIRITKAN